MANYSNGKIYKILNDVDGEVYIGSTTQLLCKRMALHRDRRHKLHMGELYRHMAAIGAEHFYIELIENYPCNNCEELRAREGFYIREIGTLNKQVAGRTKKEYESIRNKKRNETVWCDTCSTTIPKKDISRHRKPWMHQYYQNNNKCPQSVLI